jgi:hypothetical protein
MVFQLLVDTRLEYRADMLVDTLKVDSLVDMRKADIQVVTLKADMLEAVSLTEFQLLAVTRKADLTVVDMHKVDTLKEDSLVVMPKVVDTLKADSLVVMPKVDTLKADSLVVMPKVDTAVADTTVVEDTQAVGDLVLLNGVASKITGMLVSKLLVTIKCFKGKA